MVLELRDATRRLILESFAPIKTPSGVEWAEANRVLSSAESPEPGQFKFERFPYLREPQEKLVDRTTRRVVFVKPTQIGGTELGNNAIGYKMDVAPGGMIIAFPGLDLLKQWSTLKLEPMLRSTKCLQGRIGTDAHGGGKDSGDTMTRKLFANGFLIGITSGSVSALRSVTASWLVAEELDAWGPELKDQGDPLKQLEARASNFWYRKLYLPSTPSLLATSRIWKEYEKSDYRKYFVPCPHCNLMQELVWKDDKGRYRVLYDKDERGQAIPESAQYLCDCSALIDESWKEQMLATESGALWVPQKPENARRAAGYQISRLYSPITTWGEMASEWLGSHEDPRTRQTFFNLWLGMPYDAAGEGNLKPGDLSSRCEVYGEGVDVPRAAGFLTAGVDVQVDRLEVVVWAWGRDMERWLVEWKQLDGDPGQPQVWELLDEYLRKKWHHESGAELTISRTAIDAGYQPDRVHRYCDSRSGIVPIFPTIGRRDRGRLLLVPPAKKPKAYKSGQTARPNWIVGVDSAKDLLYSDFQIKPPGPDEPLKPVARCLHFGEGTDPVFFDQLLSEKLTTVYVKSQPVRVWILPDGRRNETLDCTILSFVALYQALGSSPEKHLARIVDEVNSRGGSFTAPQARAPQPPRRGGRAGNWKGIRM